MSVIDKIPEMVQLNVNVIDQMENNIIYNLFFQYCYFV